MMTWNVNTTAPLVGYSIIAVIGLFPVFSVLLTAAVARACGCRVDEGNPHPCKCCGVEIGGLLYTGGVLGWLFLLTGPVAVVLAVIWTIIILVS